MRCSYSFDEGANSKQQQLTLQNEIAFAAFVAVCDPCNRREYVFEANHMLSKAALVIDNNIVAIELLVRNGFETLLNRL